MKTEYIYLIQAKEGFMQKLLDNKINPYIISMERKEKYKKYKVVKQ
jgi:hypothetical protein